MKIILDILVSFFRTKGVAFVWITAVFAPTLLAMGIVQDKVVHLMFGAVLSLLVLLSIMDGFKALKSGLMTNFIGSALVPMVSALVGVAFAVMKIVNPN